MGKRSSMIATERVKSGNGSHRGPSAEHEARYVFAEPVRAQIGRGRLRRSGNGNGAAVFLRSSPASLVGIDVDQGAVDAANAALGGPCHVSSGEATALPLADATVDVFISLETVEHVDDDRGFLGEVTRVLKPNGVLICSTPNREVTNPASAIGHRPWNPFHVREYSPREFSDLLSERFEVMGWVLRAEPGPRPQGWPWSGSPGSSVGRWPCGSISFGNAVGFSFPVARIHAMTESAGSPR
jgi:SAM-dependent methyltransferase